MADSSSSAVAAPSVREDGAAQASRATPVSRKSRVKARDSGSAHHYGDEGDSAAAVVSSVAFLLRMADNFAMEGNLPESVKSAETALLVRQAAHDAFSAEVVQRKTRQARAWAAARGGDGHISSAEADTDRDDLALIPDSADAQAENLVLQCNSYAVAEFTHRRFDTATHFLHRALFLTERGGASDSARAQKAELADLGAFALRLRASPQAATVAGAVPSAKELGVAVGKAMQVDGPLAASSAAGAPSGFFSAAAEEQRLRLRAATLNNFGCLERRRGDAEAALAYLRQSVSTEQTLDPSQTAAASPSTYLNLCSVLNELGRHTEAVAAAQSAAVALQQQLAEQVDSVSCRRLAVMLTVALYNRGVSLERRGGPHDAVAAERAYQQSLDTSRQYGLVAADCPTVDAAVDAVRRMHAVDALPTGKSPARRQPDGGDSINAASTPSPPLPPPLLWADRAPPYTAASPAPPASQQPRLLATAPPGILPEMPGSAALMSASVHAQSPPLPGARTHRTASATWHATTHSSLGEAMVKDPPDAAARRGSANSGSPRHADEGQLPPPAIPPWTARLPSGGTDADRRNLLRPPRAPAPPSRQPHPPTLAPLFAHSSRAMSTLPSTERSRSSSTGAAALTTPPPLSARLSGGGGGGARRTSSAASYATATAELSSAPANPLGRRLFGNSIAAAATRGSAVRAAVLGGAKTSGSAASLSARGSGATKDGTPSRQSLTRQQLALQKEQQETARAKRLQEKCRRRQQREREKATAAADAQLADRLYEQVVDGMERDEMERCQAAAITLQRVWRGVVARICVASMITAAVRLQRAVRRFLVKAREEHRLQAEEQARQRALQEKREREACTVIQGRVRQFLRRLEILREKRAQRMRVTLAARVIQRGYRAYGRRRAEQLAAQAEELRRQDAQEAFRRRVAARRIQAGYHAFLDQKAARVAAEQLQQRARAATTIQALVRGVLTRAWFAFYRSYRHNEEMRSAASQRRLTIIQAACRALRSAQYCQQRQREQLRLRERQRLDNAATRIQCMWRRRVARIKMERLHAEYARRNRLAVVVQRWYRSRVARIAFQKHFAEKRRQQSAVAIQRWLRRCREQAKAREFARYHAEKLREQQLLRLKLWAIPVMQGSLRARQSEEIVASMRRSFVKRDAAARLWQRVGRGCAARKEVALEQQLARRVARKEQEAAARTHAARVLQRAWRATWAKMEVQNRRRQVAAATVLARGYRSYRARTALHDLRAARQRRAEEAAARCIQAAYRGSCRARAAKEMKDYYRQQHHKKQRRLRRGEAAVKIQSLWRGHATRRAVASVIAEHRRRTVAAQRIQRAWRGAGSRTTLRLEVATRVDRRSAKARAALTIQCFWRKLQAAERAARMRERQQCRASAVLRVQSWWRGVLARCAVAQLRYTAQQQQELMLVYAAKWERATTCVNAFLRCRESQLHCVSRLHAQLLGQLRMEDKLRFLKRHDAATAIQKMYRGHSARCCYRALLREKHAREAEEARRSAHLFVSARRIQCCYRGYAARRELRRRRQGEHERLLNEQVDLLAAADSQDVVRQMFWARGVLQQRDETAERLARARRTHRAAMTIQQAYRSHHAHQETGKAADAAKTTQAVKIVAEHWKKHRAAQAVKDSQNKEYAALRIQTHVRGWLTRRDWAQRKAEAAEEKRLQMAAENLLDNAATTIQSAWRRRRAQQQVQRIRQARRAVSVQAARDDAATVIQNAFRQYKQQ